MTDKTIKKGETLLVKGPSRVNVEKGKIEVFGKVITPKKHGVDDTEFEGEDILIIPSANSYPLYALEDSEIEVYSSSEENLHLAPENSIPKDWIELKDKLIERLKKGEAPLKIMVLGVSSGKTTLIKYLANNFLDQGFKGAYLDSDLGQQIIYLPTTLNLGTIKHPVISNEDVETEETVFIGATFPKANYKFIVSHLCRQMVDRYIEENKDTNFVLVDTDGWVKTEAGIIYKKFFIKHVEPDVLIVFYDENIEELDAILESSQKDESVEIILLKESNKYYYEKEKEERRFLRQSIFARTLEAYRKITIPLDDIKFIKRDYNKEEDKIIEVEIPVEDLLNLPYHYVIIGLLDENSNLIKIGLLFTINRQKNYILLFSDLNYKEQINVKKILLGSLRLSTKGNHQGYLYL